MENKYKIKWNASKPSAESIDKHKDFDALYKKFEQTQPKKFKRRGKIGKLLPWIGIAAAATVAFFFTIFGGPKEKPLKTKDFLAQQAYITPPVDEAVVKKFQSTHVDANQGGKVKIKSTTFHIPPRAFINRAGNLVSGEVEIKLKEYHDFVDFFVSGIPMEYDSLGTAYQLESAGMIEVYAEQDGQRVDLALGKTIDIQLESNISVDPKATKAPAFNIYKLDETNKNWVYEAPDKISFADEISFTPKDEDDLDAVYKEEKSLIAKEYESAVKKVKKTIPTPIEPQKPQRADNNAYTFELDIEDLKTSRSNIINGAIQGNDDGKSMEHHQIENSEAELRSLKKKYAKAVWEVLPNQSNWKPSISQTEWDDFDLQKTGKHDFTVTFIKGQESVDIKVKPVLMGEDYEKAMQAFTNEFQSYQKEKADRASKLQESIAELEKVRAIKEKAADLKYEEKIKAYKAAGHDNLASEEMVKRKVINNFSISEFGIWNCDRPLPPFVYEVSGDFVDNGKKPINGQMAYLVDKNRNTVYRFVTKQNAPIRFNHSSDNIMWIITKENKLATYKPNKFKEIQNGAKDHTFVMNLESADIENEEDIRRILEF